MSLFCVASPEVLPPSLSKVPSNCPPTDRTNNQATAECTESPRNPLFPDCKQPDASYPASHPPMLQRAFFLLSNQSEYRCRNNGKAPGTHYRPLPHKAYRKQTNRSLPLYTPPLLSEPALPDTFPGKPHSCFWRRHEDCGHVSNTPVLASISSLHPPPQRLKSAHRENV